MTGEGAICLLGTIPSGISKLNQLTFLNISSNLIHGTIATQLTHLSKIQGLDISNSSLRSTIPSELGELTSLTFWFHMSANCLTVCIDRYEFHLPLAHYCVHFLPQGTIPSELGKLTQLNYKFALSWNNLNGKCLNGTRSFIVVITTTCVQSTGIAGTIPTELGKLVNLPMIHLPENSLTVTAHVISNTNH